MVELVRVAACVSQLASPNGNRRAGATVRPVCLAVYWAQVLCIARPPLSWSFGRVQLFLETLLILFMCVSIGISRCWLLHHLVWDTFGVGGVGTGNFLRCFFLGGGWISRTLAGLSSQLYLSEFFVLDLMSRVFSCTLQKKKESVSVASCVELEFFLLLNFKHSVLLWFCESQEDIVDTKKSK